MTEQNFQTPPLPPKAPTFTPGMASPQPAEPAVSAQPAAAVTPATTPVETSVTELPADHFAARLKLPVSIYRTKAMAGLMGGMVFVGILLGAMMFGGSAPTQQAPTGLLGVVPNKDIQEDLPRCGRASETSPCIVYLVNHSRNDKLAEEFFTDAVRITGRQEYLVKIENKQYTKTRIPPGYIAQIKIPRLR